MIPFWLNPARLLDLARSRRLRVAGHSMQPLLLQGDLILATRRFPHNGHPQRGDVVAFHEPLSNEISVKRVCGIPNETVALTDGVLIVDGQPIPESYIVTATGGAGRYGDMQWTLGPDEYILLGDNRGDSLDSRAYGPVPRSAIIGRAWYRYAPAARSGPLPR